HAGPPAALLGRELELLPDAADFEIGRMTFEILRSVPIAPVRVSARITRPGRRVQLLEAELSVDGEVLMMASAWRIRRGGVGLPPAAAAPDPPPPGPEGGREGDFFPTAQEDGYHTAMEAQFQSGGFMEVGPATVWMRMRQPLVSGEDPSPLQR